SSGRARTAARPRAPPPRRPPRPASAVGAALLSCRRRAEPHQPLADLPQTVSGRVVPRGRAGHRLALVDEVLPAHRRYLGRAGEPDQGPRPAFGRSGEELAEGDDQALETGVVAPEPAADEAGMHGVDRDPRALQTACLLPGEEDVHQLGAAVGAEGAVRGVLVLEVVEVEAGAAGARR